MNANECSLITPLTQRLTHFLIIACFLGSVFLYNKVLESRTFSDSFANVTMTLVPVHSRHSIITLMLVGLNKKNELINNVIEEHL